ncbi:DUF1214 domain-containing protein [Plantibacter sp. Mn2098]|uniref:DUF1214 domain-containing protein n=1 Tax=Plantibacter sp. Mn2098 TaxID=3395266 RepID=UPI003BBB094F
MNVDNFVEAETGRMFAALQVAAGGVNTFRHNAQPASIDEQTVVRLNRDTLYSFAIADISAGATLTLPDAGDRYISAMIVNEDHLINRIFHTAGSFELTTEEFGSPHVLVAVRILADPDDEADLAVVGALQQHIGLQSRSSKPYALTEYDAASLDETRSALLTLAKGVGGYRGMFGTADEISPVRHLIGTASGWGGLPESEAVYVGVDPGLAPGSYTMTMRDAPADAFWSISVYNAEGYFEPNPAGRYTINSITAKQAADGSITVHFVDDPTTNLPNAIPTPQGWNLLVRLYRPRAAYFDGTWTVPPIVATDEATA